MSNNNETFEVMVKIKIECFNQDDANYIAEKYANMALQYASIGAETAEIISVIKLDEQN